MSSILDTVLAATNPASYAQAPMAPRVDIFDAARSGNTGGRAQLGAAARLRRTGREAFASQDIHFATGERPLAVIGRDGVRGAPLASHKAIIRANPSDPEGAPIVLGVVGKDYKRVATRDVTTAIENALTSALPASAFDRMEVRDAASFDGAYTARTYILPALGGDVVQKGGREGRTSLGFLVRVSNTYDGSGAVRLSVGNYDFYCTNGCVRGDFDAASKRHSSGLRIDFFGRMITKAVEEQQTLMGRIRRWAEMGVTTRMVEEALKDTRLDLSERAQARLLETFQREAAIRGSTTWALASALTHDATHGPMRDTGSDHAAATIARRQTEAGRQVSILEEVILAAQRAA